MQLPSIYQVCSGLRQGLATASTVLPRERSVAFERWLRGCEDSLKLARADGVIVSFGKSGRTWVNVLTSRYFAKRFNLTDKPVMTFDDFHRLNRSIPVLFFTHDNYLKDFVGRDEKLANYGRSRIVLLVRDPRDTIVSQYFQWKHRMAERKKVINAYPLQDLNIYDFTVGEAAGIPKVLRFMNAWARDLDSFPNLLLVKYELLRTETQRSLRGILEFLGQEPTDEELDDCVSYGSIENMRQIERQNAETSAADTRLRPGDAGDPASYKVRRGKVGGWRDYMTEEQAAKIDNMVREGLSPIFGYR